MRFDKHVALTAARPAHAREALHALTCEVLPGGMGTENHIPLHDEQFFHVLGKRLMEESRNEDQGSKNRFDN